jgi:hypothetical protein
MSPASLPLAFDPTPLAVARLDSGAAVPDWAVAPGARFVTVTRTAEELSIVAPAARVPAGVRAEGPFVSFRVRGTLEFGLVGIVAALADPLAAAGIPVFVVSTFDTDWVLVPEGLADRARQALAAAGHDLGGPPTP